MSLGIGDANRASCLACIDYQNKQIDYIGQLVGRSDQPLINYKRNIENVAQVTFKKLG